MDRLERILGAVGLQRKAQTPNVAGVTSDALSIWLSDKGVSDAQAMQQYNNWVYTCMKAIAEEIGKMEFVLMRFKPNGNDEQIHDHELLDLLEAVNSYQTSFELKYSTSTHLEAVGNAYIFLDGVEKNPQAKPTGLYLLNPDAVVIERAPAPQFVSGYKYRAGNTTVVYQPHQILHLKFPNPRDPVKGIGTVQAIADWIDADNYATEFNRKFFKNGAHIGGFLTSDSAYTPEQLDYLRKSFEEIYKGVDNAYKTAALPKGAKFEPAQQSQKEMDFVEGQRQMRDKILAGFRVPHIVLGLGAGESLNRATAEAGHYVFMSRTIRPKMELICTYLNEFLVPRYGKDIYLTFKDPVPENRELSITEMAATDGILSINEKRERYFELGEIENGDAVMAPFNLMPVGSPKKAVATAQAKAVTKGKPTTRHAKNNRNRKEMADELAAKTMAILEKHKGSLEEVKHKNISQLSHEEYGVVHKAFVLRVEPYVKLLAEKVRDFNAQLKTEVEKNLVSAVKAFASKTKAIDPDDLYDSDEQIGIMVRFTKPTMTELYAKEGIAAGELIGIDGMDIINPKTRQALEKVATLMAQNYTETTALLLKDQLEQGLADGESMRELTKRVETIFEFSDTSRAEMVARTESYRVANDATKEAWTESGVVKTIRWYTADSEACAFCEPLDGTIVDIEQNFFEIGDTVRGTNGQTLDITYADIGGGALHPNCRCYTRPDEISIEASMTPEPEEVPAEVKIELPDLIKEEVAKQVEKAKGEISEKIDQALNE